MLSNDKGTAAERLTTLFRATARWATPVRAPEASGKSRGCLHPVFLVKTLVMLIMVVLLPLFILPLMLVRLALYGRTSVKYSSTIRMASGEPARWSHGRLDPGSDAPSLQAGLAAIASHDPEFSAATLTNWAAAATGLLCQSLTAADPNPARTFMVNGLFRSYSALLELRTQADVSCEGSWHAVEAVVVQAVRTPLFDEVRVRLRCQGWCWERHGPTDLTLRGGPDGTSWLEDMTFGRSAHAVSPVAGGLPARHCPSCGAPLDLDPDGACRYCHGIVTAGRHDWVLTAWRREPW
jgi:hypothetical protein